MMPAASHKHQLRMVRAENSIQQTTEISEEDYKHGKIVWKKIGNKFDATRPLPSIRRTSPRRCFKDFKNKCMKNCRLNPGNYYFLTRLSWDAALQLMH